jgi:hypothetical protein
VASVGTVVGSVTGLMAMSKKSSVDEECVAGRCPPSTHDDIDAGRTLGTVSTVSFVLAGAGAAVGVWALLGDEKPPSDSKPNAPSAAV